MYTKHKQSFISRDDIYRMLSKEDEYAAGWGEAEENGTNSVFPENCVSAITGQPFSMMDWIVFAEKYIDEARLAFANYCPDEAAVRIRILKAASLFVTALQVHGYSDDIDKIAGVSSSDNYPILHGGLEVLRRQPE